MSKGLLKSTSVVGGMTLVSRVSGLVRDVAFAQFLGAGLLADAFFVAFRVPNFFRRIFGEGAFTVAFVPVFTEVRDYNEPGTAQSFLALMAGRLGLLLVLLVALGIVFAEPIVSILAWGWTDSPEKIEVTVKTLRLTFPYLLFISLVSMAAGILNTCGRFAAAAVTPVFLNICLIAAVLWFVPWFENAAIALGFGVFLAGVVQLLFQFPFLAREGYIPRPRLRNRAGDDPRAVESSRQVFKLMLPALFGSSIAQINILVNTVIASLLVTGSVSWLYYSDRLMEFPLGVFGIALATAILAGLSRQHVDGDTDGFNRTLNTAIMWVWVVAIPAGFALIVLAEPLITTLFNYRAFSLNDVIMSARALEAYALGLIGFVLVKVLAPGFFARQNTATPVRIGAVAVGVNIVVSLLLFRPLGHVGLAIATSVSAFVNAGLLGWKLKKERVLQVHGTVWHLLIRTMLASIVMAMVLWWFSGTAELWAAYDLWQRIGRLSLLVITGMLVYAVTLLILGVRPAQLMLTHE